ncbi:response regulator [Desulfosporosinus youngiae]|uniref:Stage 0 sporulation protein A homolog n=1 Tax=Desulfosporosinus youngiae DSM 17734 TaxID=768710 RepID=H5XV27_9FIRM|nr:tetratricopeptide repeat protein [Desulfosporosinus youngiae]EHQ89479.1 response regulator with CheY-like receiver, AAA-type ATPase, and DNA-binding domains [Desulfosporosinus youngiae DSM 17734]
MKKALVVDDTKSNRLFLSKCLESEGYLVKSAGNGKQAMDLLKAENYHIIFLDIKMPYMSGTEVFKWLTQQGIKAPVVITTAYATVKNAVECTQMGAVAYLQKPFTLARFRELVLEIEQKISGSTVKTNFIPDPVIENQEDFQVVKRDLECDNPAAALIYLKQALSEDPANPEIYRLLSEAYYSIGNKDYAEKFMQASEVFKVRDLI